MPAARSPEFRRRALDLVDQGEPVAEVARNLGISENTLRRSVDWPQMVVQLPPGCYRPPQNHHAA